MRSLLVAAFATLATPALAEGWTFAISPYLWLPGLDSSASTARGDFDVSLSTSDVLSNLDFGFMGVAEARNGPWGLALDVIYSDLSAGRDFRTGAPFSRASVSNRLTAATLYAAYRAVDTDRGSLDLLAGARYFDISFRLSVDAGTRPGFSLPTGQSWTDPVVGLRGIYNFNEQWSGTVVADLGGFSGDSSTWQAVGTVGYRLDDAWSIQGGWRYMSISKDLPAADLDIELTGPLIGLTYRF